MLSQSDLIRWIGLGHYAKQFSGAKFVRNKNLEGICVTITTENLRHPESAVSHFVIYIQLMSHK